MKLVHIGRLQRASTSRKPGYNEAIMKVGAPVTRLGQPFYQVTDADYFAIRKAFALEPRSVAPKISVEKSIPSIASAPINPILRKPGPIQLARNLATTAGKTIIAAAKGQQVLVTAAQNEERLSICANCDKLINKEQPREAWECALCGCNLAGKLFAAATLRTKDCPAGKWPKLTPPAP